ncbi:hypothetical protein ElyMa_004998900 [Elysia marginata]|uniref:Uncharacterized protein n=1 Tax=Elysia marginata TaxID=1093978 RepID=A0AAV4J7Y7_9GAST|nr:hypothetical protein ElyMa_004998900 [Elysia marginata]
MRKLTIRDLKLTHRALIREEDKDDGDNEDVGDGSIAADSDDDVAGGGGDTRRIPREAEGYPLICSRTSVVKKLEQDAVIGRLVLPRDHEGAESTTMAVVETALGLPTVSVHRHNTRVLHVYDAL